LKNYQNCSIKVESSDIRIFTDAEYTNVGIEVATDISDCDVLFGVKVPLENLIPNKAYFFSHTIKNSPTIENYYRQF
jgi:hypothetical protein